MCPNPTDQVSLEDWLQAGGGTATLVLSDVVRSTLLLFDAGSVSYMGIIEAHRNRAVGLLKALEGRVVDMSGDSVFAVFPRAGDAFRYGCALIDDSGDARVKVRVGIHHGLVHARGDGLFGRSVHYLARLARRGGDSELWTSDPARLALETDAPDLARALTLERQNDVALDGIPGRHTLWQVTGRAAQGPGPY
ncbi:MAG: hypothetical protein QNK04_18355 [Myxococcota bacterium]|nr:hypothetical protein [Myxococcota bacterium]